MFKNVSCLVTQNLIDKDLGIYHLHKTLQSYNTIPHIGLGSFVMFYISLLLAMLKSYPKKQVWGQVLNNLFITEITLNFQSVAKKHYFV